MSELDNGANHIFSVFDEMETEALEEILRQDFQQPADEESNTDAILYIMEVLAERERKEQKINFTPVDVAWKSFNENYRPYDFGGSSLYEDEVEDETPIHNLPKQGKNLRPKRTKLFRAAVIAAVLVGAFLATTIAAYAFGYDIWETVAKWTNDIFSFSTTVQQSPEIASASVDNVGAQMAYTSLEDALVKYGITENLISKWIPEGYAFISVDVAETPFTTTFRATWENGDDELFVRIVHYLNGVNSTYEKDESIVDIYVAGGIEHYIMNNNDWIRAVWVVDAYECSIWGDFSQDTLQLMIDSIYER